jgi:hypothetical protein
MGRTESDTVSDSLGRLGDGAVRVGGFSSGDDNGLHTDEREGGVDEGSDESEEVSSRTLRGGQV